MLVLFCGVFKKVVAMDVSFRKKRGPVQSFQSIKRTFHIRQRIGRPDDGFDHLRNFMDGLQVREFKGTRINVVEGFLVLEDRSGFW